VAIVRPDQVWSTDITYVPMPRGFMYLTVSWFSLIWTNRSFELAWPKMEFTFVRRLLYWVVRGGLRVPPLCAGG
jgi:hypothetical protein